LSRAGFGVDAGVVEDHPNVCTVLRIVPRGVLLLDERQHEVSDLRGFYLVDGTATEQPANPLDLQTVARLRGLGNVDADRQPARSDDTNRRRLRRLVGELAQVGNALVDELTADVVAADLRQPVGLEAAAVADLRLAAA
jgi:hypothetical protein